MATGSSRAHLVKQGRDVGHQRNSARVAGGGDMRSTRRPYEKPEEVEGSKSAGKRGAVEAQ